MWPRRHRGCGRSSHCRGGRKQREPQAADTLEKPRRGSAGCRTEPWGQGWGPRGGSHGGGRRGLPAKPDSARARQRERGREARQCYSRHRTLGPEPCGPRVLAQTRSEGASQEAGRDVLPGHAQGIRLQALENPAARLATGRSPAQPPPGAQAGSRRAAAVDETVSLPPARAREPAQEMQMASCQGERNPPGPARGPRQPKSRKHIGIFHVQGPLVGTLYQRPQPPPHHHPEALSPRADPATRWPCRCLGAAPQACRCGRASQNVPTCSCPAECAESKGECDPLWGWGWGASPADDVRGTESPQLSLDGGGPEARHGSPWWQAGGGPRAGTCSLRLYPAGSVIVKERKRSFASERTRTGVGRRGGHSAGAAVCSLSRGLNSNLTNIRICQFLY